MVTISRAKTAIDFPASFILLASMNPCPCGYFNHPDKDCTCAPGQVQRYLNKVSGPLLDRIDLHVEVTPVKFNDLVSAQEAEKSSYIRDRVIAARAIQAARFKDYKGIYCNAQMHSSLMFAVCVISESCRRQLARAMQQLKLSARAYDRILKVSRTIADLEGSRSVEPSHMAEAIQFRSLDREGWGN
jgi:magnesium chelatase family protein